VGSSRARARRVTLLLGRRGGTWAPGALLRHVRMCRNAYAAAGKVEPPALEGAQEPSEAAQTPAPPRKMRRIRPSTWSTQEGTERRSWWSRIFGGYPRPHGLEVCPESGRKSLPTY
jgi:hypothetical protein